MSMWMVYSDGACVPNPGKAGWGAVIIAPDGTEEQAYGLIGHGTNQVAEITAAIEGLSRVPVGVEVELVSDSQYVLRGLSEWRRGWERRGWLNAQMQPVANQALWQMLFAVADQRKVSTRWVRGHNGDLNNEKADALANLAIGGKPASEKKPRANRVGALNAALQLLDTLAPAEASRIRQQYRLA